MHSLETIIALNKQAAERHPDFKVILEALVSLKQVAEHELYSPKLRESANLALKELERCYSAK